MDTVRAVIYDLDGTLYDDDRPVQAYAERLLRLLRPGAQERFQRDWEAARRGRHPLKPGMWYDPGRGWILEVHSGTVTAVGMMDGSPVPQGLWPPEYAAGGTSDAALVPVGDLWWIAFCLALHHGAPLGAVQEAFLSTRAWMASPAFRPRPVPGLREAIMRLKAQGVYQMMATNSPRADSEALLERLGLAGLFEECVFEARKPHGLELLVLRVCRQLAVMPAAVVAVGDNWINDIEPAVRLGCRGLWLDRYGVDVEVPGAVRITSSDMLVDELRRLADATPGGLGAAGR